MARLDIADHQPDDREEIVVDLAPLPDGYTIPNVSPPMPPLCGHSVRTPAGGWAGVCDEPATWEASWQDQYGDPYGAFVCDEHRNDIVPSEWERR